MPRYLACVLITALLLAAVPLSYPIFRLVPCIITAWSAWRAWHAGGRLIAAMWAALALIFNPLLPVPFNQGAWSVVDIAVAVLVAALVWLEILGMRQPET